MIWSITHNYVVFIIFGTGQSLPYPPSLSLYVLNLVCTDSSTKGTNIQCHVYACYDDKSIAGDIDSRFRKIITNLKAKMIEQG